MAMLDVMARLMPRAICPASTPGLTLRALGAALWLLAVCAGARAQSFQTIAPQAVLFDVETKAVLFAQGADEAIPPASLAKLMTAEVVFNEIANGRLSLDSEMIVSENAWRKGGAPSGGSAMFLSPNSAAKVSDLLAGLLVVSGNDAAIVLAEGIAGQEENFAKLMNARAKALGFRSLQFGNATGLAHPDNRVTMREMVLLADHIIGTYPELYKVFAQREILWNRVRQQSRNPLLAMDIGADGLKTGFLEEAGYSLIGSAVQNGQRLIVGVSGLKTIRDRSAESRKLLDWGFRSFEIRNLFPAGQPIERARVYGGADSAVDLVAQRDIRLPLPRGTQDRVSARVIYDWPLRAPVKAGAAVGRVEILRNSAVVMRAPVFAAADVGVGSLQQRAWDAAYELGGQLIRSAFARLKVGGPS